jgi:hypothetical protein
MKRRRFLPGQGQPRGTALAAVPPEEDGRRREGSVSRMGREGGSTSTLTSSFDFWQRIIVSMVSKALRRDSLISF